MKKNYLRTTRVLAEELKEINKNLETLAKKGDIIANTELINVQRILALHACGVTHLKQKEFDKYKN